MYTTNVDKWYCCLNAAERAAVQVCAANAGPLTYYVAGLLFDACWLLAVEGSASIRREIFIEDWGLTKGTIPPTDPDGFVVFYLDPAIWDDINAFLLTPEAFCDDGCKVREFSN